MESLDCPRERNKCTTCGELAKTALILTFTEQNTALDVSVTALVVENSKLLALVEEQNGVEMLSCRQRQERAVKIGHEQALRLSKSPLSEPE